MSWLFASGHAVDLILIIMAAELLALIIVWKWHPVTALLRLAPGALMLIALRNALTGTDWRWIALPLLLSLPVHLADLARSSSRPGEGPR